MRRYTDDFKRDAIDYIKSHPDLTVEEVARYLNVPKDTLYGWIKAYHRAVRASNSGEAPVKGPLTDEEKEIARLKRELRDTQDALEILKKAISILGD